MQRKILYLLLLGAAVIVVAMLVVVLTQPRSAPTPPLQLPTKNPDVAAATEPPKGTSPIDVVRQFFDRWNAKDLAGMDACRVESDEGLYASDELAYEQSVELIRCEEQSKEEALARFDQSFYDMPYDVALVLSDYVVHYNEAGKAFYARDSVEHTGFQFWLVKESADGGWRIAMQGY